MLGRANSIWARHFVTICGFAIILPAVSALAPPRIENADETGKRGANSSLTGVWESQGYGLVYVASGDALQAYEVTHTTCVPIPKRLTRRAETATGAEAVYANGVWWS